MSDTTRPAWLATVLLLALPIPSARAEEPSPWQFSLQLGSQFKDVSGERSSKFEEYQDVEDGAVVDQAALRFENPASPWRFELSGVNLTRRDERASLSWARPGRFRLDGSWSRTPHFLSRGATSLWAQSGGELRLPDALQNQIESFFGATPAPTTAQARAFMTSLLDQAGREIDLRTRRDTAKLALGLDLTRAWRLRAFAESVEKSGTSRIGSGTYIRRQTVNSFDRDRFEPRGAELPLPIDSTTRDFGLGTGLHGKGWFFDLGWQQSSFSNDLDSLVWDNPFEGPPGATSSRTGLNPGFEQEPSGTTSNTGNRGRFPSAELALFPDNDFERVHASGAVTLPARTRVNASYSSATTRQDDAFLAYTLNPAVIYANGPDGIGGTADDVLARDVALPRSSLDGEIRTTRTDLKISSRPIERLSLRGSYRRYRYEDETPSILFPGFAAAGDSYFRPGIGQRDAAGVRALFNEPGGYTRSAWSMGGAWRFGEPATLDLEFTQTDWDYDERQVESTAEDQVVARVRLALGDRVEARLSYLDASRDFEGAYAVGFESSRLRAFDVWKRERTRFGLEAAFLLTDRFTLGLSGQSLEDQYPETVALPSPPPSGNPFPSLEYGLNEALDDSYSASLAYAADRWNLTAALGIDHSEWTSLAVAKTSLTGESPQFDPVNRWIRTQDDDVLWGNLAFEAEIGEKGKLTAELGYHDYDGSYRTFNPATPNVNDGVAYRVPDFASSLFSGKVSFEWAYSPHLDFGVRYWYEPYSLDDWQWDLVQPYMQGVFQETGGSPGAIRDATAFRVLFLDATYSDYTASVASVFVRIKS